MCVFRPSLDELKTNQKVNSGQFSPAKIVCHEIFSTRLSSGLPLFVSIRLVGKQALLNSSLMVDIFMGQAKTSKEMQQKSHMTDQSQCG